MQTDNAGVKFPPPLLYAVALVIGLGLSHLLPVAHVADAVLHVVGAVLFASGFVLAVAARARFQRAGTNINPTKPTTALVVAGPFRFTRNPMYLGLTLAYLGVTVYAQSLWALLLLPIVLVVIQRQVIDREERYLERKFGPAYLQYKARVRRWL